MPKGLDASSTEQPVELDGCRFHRCAESRRFDVDGLLYSVRRLRAHAVLATACRWRPVLWDVQRQIALANHARHERDRVTQTLHPLPKQISARACPQQMHSHPTECDRSRVQLTMSMIYLVHHGKCSYFNPSTAPVMPLSEIKSVKCVAWMHKQGISKGEWGRLDSWLAMGGGDDAAAVGTRRPTEVPLRWEEWSICYCIWWAPVPVESGKPPARVSAWWVNR